jgi:protein-L-isoaspartate O-methyltransferase
MNEGDGEGPHKEDDNFSERFSGWHYQLGWGDGSASVAPYVPTPQSLVNRMLELVEAGPGDILYDLGCGDGRFLITAVDEFNVEKAVGYEINKHLYEVAEDNIAKSGLIDQIRIESGDFMEADFSEATIITLYLTTSGNAKLRPKFIEELKPGTRIISHDFPIMEWTLSTPEKEPLNIGTHKVFMYSVPEAYTEENEKETPSENRWGRIKKLFERR